MAHATEGPYTSIGQASADPTVSPHVALLLPTGSDAFVKPAEAVRSGFLDASKKHIGAPIPVRLYAVTDDPKGVIATYREAIAAGARIVVGPLTRNGVTAVATTPGLITVPTLALNVPEGVASNPLNLYTLSLQVEAEARQVAQVALREGRRKTLTITNPTVLARRMRDAFVDEFQRGGGYQIADYSYATDAARLEQVRQAASLGVADMVFLAVDAEHARAIRPQVSGLQAYGTSQINPGAGGVTGLIDLTDVRFIDMPWILQPDHPAVMVYGGGTSHAPDDFQRLYALGIDAFRIAEALLAGKRDIEIDGVTGRLTLTADGQIKRVLPIALIVGGQMSVGEARP